MPTGWPVPFRVSAEGLAGGKDSRFNGAMPRDPYIREKFTRERTAARNHAKDYFECFPKDRYQTEVESWRPLQSQNIEFTMKRLREPINDGSGRPGGLIAAGNAGSAIR
jgi:hypothetical protein